MAKEYVRSRPYIWSAGARIPVDLSFLEATLSKYRSPVIEKIYLRMTGSVTSASVTLENFSHAALVAANFLWRDRRGERINLTGREIRIAAQMEFGDAFQDPADQASSTNASFECILPITFCPKKSRRRADFRPAIAEMISGEVIWTAAAAVPVTGVTINSALLELHAVVTDEVVPEAASRMCWLGVNATLAEDTYYVDGALRFAYMYAHPGDGTADITSLATYTEIDSYTLDMVDTNRTILRDDYSQESQLDATNDEVARNRILPLLFPKSDQKTTALRNVNKLHVRLQAVLPTGGRLVYCTITDRDPVLTAAALQIPPSMLASTPVDLPTAKGSTPINTVPPDAARKLPIRVAD